MSFRLEINDKSYIHGSRDLIKTEYDLSNNRVSLRGFYYGSGTCLDGTGSGWIVKVKPIKINENQSYIFSDHQTIKLKLYYHNKLVEEIEVDYPFFDVREEIEVDGVWIKKIFLRSLHRWGGNTPLEIAGVEIEKHPIH
jgi:hypothetical protein